MVERKEMKVKFFVELKQGYRKTTEIEETKEIEIVIEAENMVTASRMFKALADVDNITEYNYVCIEY